MTVHSFAVIFNRESTNVAHSTHFWIQSSNSGVNTDWISPKAPVTLYCDPTAWARRFEISQSAVGSHKNTKNIAKNFTFSITWKCHGAPTATVAFPRSAHGVPPRSHGVLTGDWLCGHGALVACKELSLRMDGVHTVRTARPMRFYGVFTECIWAYEKTSAPGILQKSSCI